MRYHKYYNLQHHDLDIHPIPKEEGALFVNEPWLVDATLCEIGKNIEPEKQSDNRRIYVPLDLNQAAILRRLDDVIRHYGEVNEQNESDFSQDVQQLLYQVEIYDQIWYVRHMPKDGNHSLEANELMKKFIACLEDIPDGGAEVFPFELITELREEYGSDL